MKDIIDTSTSK
ncbi:hypothetical protein LINPERPRIM_LOCUS38735 [Linum perenne]